MAANRAQGEGVISFAGFFFSASGPAFWFCFLVLTSLFPLICLFLTSCPSLPRLPARSVNQLAIETVYSHQHNLDVSHPGRRPTQLQEGETEYQKLPVRSTIRFQQGCEGQRMVVRRFFFLTLALVVHVVDLGQAHRDLSVT